MIASQVQDKLQRVYSHPAASQPKRSSGEGYATHEAHREIDVFHFVKSQDADRDGQVEIHHPGHSLAIPSRREVGYSGCVQTGSMQRIDGLFVTTTDTHSKPNFETYVDTQFSPDGIVKREATFAPDGVSARLVSVNHLDPSLNYVEEFRIAGQL
jgi:hypothetical protein